MAGLPGPGGGGRMGGLGSLRNLGKNERRLFLALVTVAVLIIGYISYQILTDDDDKKESSQEQPSPRPTDGHEEDEDGIHPEPDHLPEPSPADPAGIQIAKTFVDNYLRRDRAHKVWYEHLEPDCEHTLCAALEDAGPSSVRELAIAGEPTVTESTTVALILEFPTDIGRQLRVMLGKPGGEVWKVYEIGVN